MPPVFQETHGWNALEGGLAFLGLPIGGTVAVLVYAFYFNKVYMRKHHELKGKMVPPEERLKPLMVAAPAFAVSFFWGKSTDSTSRWSTGSRICLLHSWLDILSVYQSRFPTHCDRLDGLCDPVHVLVHF